MSAHIPSLPVSLQLTGDEAISAAAWSPSASHCAVATLHGEILVYLGATDGPLNLTGHQQGTFALLWWDDDLLISGGGDGTVRLWTISTGEMKEIPLERKNLWVEKLALSPDRQLLAVGAGPTLSLWNRQRTQVRSYTKRSSTIADLQWHPQGKFLASVANAEVCFWRAGRDQVANQFTYASSLLCGRWSPRGDWFVVGCQDATLHLWITASGEDLYMSGFERKIRELDFHPKGRWLAVGGSPEITVWDFSGAGPAGTTPRRLMGHEDFVSQLTFSSNGQYLASGSEDGRVLLWEAEGKPFPLATYWMGSPITQLVWKPDSQSLLIGDENGQIAICPIKF